MEDSQIVRLFFRRDQAAIKETAEKYGTQLHYFAMRILSVYEDAEECCNDTYWKAWNSIPPQRPAALYPYLARICRFLACDRLDWLNAKKRNATIISLTAEMERCIPDTKADDQFDKEELGRMISDFLRRQPKENSMIFMRRYWYADSIGEIAARYQMSEGKVKMSLYRTRKKLKEYLEKKGVIV